jgi:hypothetical protein
MSIKPGKYIHFKGKEYEVTGIAVHSETLEDMVVYRSLYGDGKIWVRPAAMCNEIVEHNGRLVKRFTHEDDFIEETSPAGISNRSTNDEKVELFLSLFRGCSDVYARRWESKDGLKSGYTPICRNENNLLPP